MAITQTSKGQSFNYHFQQVTLQTEGYTDFLEKLESYGEKRAGLPGLDSTRSYIQSQLIKWGYHVSLDTFNYGGFEQYNVIATKPGRTSELVLIGAHYDTRGGPGSNDNGSGVAATLTTARVMAGQANKRSLMFCFYAAEESNLIGSVHHASQFERYDDLVLMFNVDQIAGIRGGENRYIIIEDDRGNVKPENDQPSSLMADTIEQLCRLYTGLEPRRDRAYSSDYMSYERYGAVIAGLYHDNYGSFTHSSQDLLTNMDTTTLREVVRLTIATTLHFAGHDLPLSIPDQPGPSHLHFYPNPAVETLHIRSVDGLQQIQLYDSRGALCRRTFFEGKPTEIEWNISDLQSGIYWLVATDGLVRTKAAPLVIHREH
jgi:hypothetical protein